MTTYTVTEIGGCRIVSGAIPLSAFSMLSSGLGKDAVMDADMARMMGANLAFGSPKDIAELKRDPVILAGARAKVAVYLSKTSPAAVEWLATGQRAASSEAMFYRFTGIGEKQDNAPLDPDDLKRCRLLLEQVPDFLPMLPLMADVSPVWSALVEHWDELTKLMDSESPKWRNNHGRAPSTAALMDSLSERATAHRPKM